MLSGSKAWLWQRLSAVYLTGFTLWLIAVIGFRPPADVADWAAFWGHGGVALATVLATAALLMHAWIGLRDVIMDYVHPLGLRITLFTIAAFGFVVIGAWVVAILLDMRHLAGVL
ncbi:MAG: succinate dehydrogenase, hydrophobic membrane anchor protein [Thioalkalivibrionaceae bacterium]